MTSPVLTVSTRECPDVAPRITMCDYHTVDIRVVDGATFFRSEGIRSECFWVGKLISNDPATYAGVCDAITAKFCCAAASILTECRVCSSACPLGLCNLPPCWWALVGGVGHVEVGHTCPASSAVAASPSHAAEHLNCRSIAALEPVVTRRGSRLAFADLLARGCRIVLV